MASEGAGARGAQITPASHWGPGTSENIKYILRIGRALLLGFIETLRQKYRTWHSQADLLEHPEGEDMPDTSQVTSLKECMLHIWQNLSSNQQITSMVESVTGDNPLEILANVSEHTFATGINWGRIVVFFYFAYRVIARKYYLLAYTAVGEPREDYDVVKAVEPTGTYSSDWFNIVVNWAMDFLRDRLAAWIQQQGGWMAMLSYFPSSE